MQNVGKYFILELFDSHPHDFVLVFIFRYPWFSFKHKKLDNKKLYLLLLTNILAHSKIRKTCKHDFPQFSLLLQLYKKYNSDFQTSATGL